MALRALLVLALGGACLAVDSVFGRRLNYRATETAALLRGYKGDYPLVLYNVASETDRGRFCSALVEQLGGSSVVYDVRDAQPDGTSELSSYEATLLEYLQALSDNSDHYSSVYLMDEKVLDSLSEPLREFMDATVKPIGVGLKENLFEHFPEALRPKKALVVGGLGARSFLHSDPYAWIGTNFLYEGRKVWTFLPPDAAESAEMLARAKPVDAFGTPIAAGRVSDIDLYHRIVESNPGCALNRRWVSHLGGSGRNDDLPLFGSSHDLSEAAVERALQIVQEEGDLVIIPQNWWHQVYHLQPSIAIAFQYFDRSIKDDVLRHMLEFCSGSAAYGRLRREEGYSALSDAAQVRRAVELAVNLARDRNRSSDR